MKKINLQKKYESYYDAKAKPEIVTVEAASYISILAHGSFMASIFRERISVLKDVALTLAKNLEETSNAFHVPPFECLYWLDDKLGYTKINDLFFNSPNDKLEYRLLIRIPEHVSKKDITDAVAKVTKGDKLAKEITHYELTEGKVVQYMHEGALGNEEESLDKMQEFIDSKKLVKGGHHHEIYLVDFTTMSMGSMDDTLRTILRDQVKGK